MLKKLIEKIKLMPFVELIGKNKGNTKPGKGNAKDPAEPQK